MFRLQSHLLITALATIGIFIAPTPAESLEFNHVTAAVSGTVDPARPGTPCDITGWEDPVLHTRNTTVFPDRPGNHIGFQGLVLEGTFHLSTVSFTGAVRALTTILACSTQVVTGLGQGDALLSYGLILPGSFSSPTAGLLVLDPLGGASCLYGKLQGQGLFLTLGVVAIALITIEFRIDHFPGVDLGEPCPVSPDHSGNLFVSAIAVLAVIPCGEAPPPGCVVEPRDLVVGVVQLLPVLTLESLISQI